MIRVMQKFIRYNSRPVVYIEMYVVGCECMCSCDGGEGVCVCVVRMPAWIHLNSEEKLFGKSPGGRGFKLEVHFFNLKLLIGISYYAEG